MNFAVPFGTEKFYLPEIVEVISQIDNYFIAASNNKSDFQCNIGKLKVIRRIPVKDEWDFLEKIFENKKEIRN